MKKTAFVAIATCIVVLATSCKKNTNTSSKEEALELKAPSGQQIASGIQQLKAEAARVILFKHNTEQPFQITNVNYLAATKGYAAIVAYTLQDGTAGSYAVFSGVKYNVTNAAELSVVPRNKNSHAMADAKVTITCRGTCNCVLSATINANTGVITVDCGCSNCKAEISAS